MSKKNAMICWGRVIFMSLFAAICAYQCLWIINSYIKNPTIIDIQQISNEANYWFPGVTICNNNRVSLRKLMRKEPALERELKLEYPNLYKDRENLANAKYFENFRNRLNQLLKKLNIQPQAYLDNSTMVERFDLLPHGNPFIKTVSCSRIEGIDCNQTTRIESLQDRSCVTMMHLGAMKYDSKHHSEILKPRDFNISQSLNVTIERNEIVRITVDYEPEDYGDLKRQVGARITLHANGYVASASDKDFYMARGYRYEFKVTREDMAPRDCVDYEGANLASFERKLNPRRTLHRETCLQNCIARNMIRLTGCWPPSIAYFRDDPLDPHRNLSQCGWFREPQYFTVYRDMVLWELYHLQAQNKEPDPNIEERIQNVKMMYRYDMAVLTEVKKHCAGVCKRSCTFSRFTLSRVTSLYPSNMERMIDRSGTGKVLSFCCSIVVIKRVKASYQRFQFLTKYSQADTIGNLGGVLAFWLGLSIMSVYKFMRRLTEFLNRRPKIRPKLHSQCALEMERQIYHLKPVPNKNKKIKMNPINESSGERFHVQDNNNNNKS